MNPDTGWHLDDELADRYASGGLDAMLATSVEAHLLTCAHCRAAVAPRAPAARLDRMWAEIAESVDAPIPGPFERLLLLWAGMGDHTARLLGASHSLRLSWIASAALALLFAVLATRETTRWGLLGFLTLAPIVPVAGVSTAFGRGADPAYEIGLAAPYSMVKVTLLRAAAILTTSIVPALAIGLTLFGHSWTVIAWLLPALALTTLSLALSTWWEPQWCAVTTVTAWLVGITLTNVREQSLAMFGTAAQLAYLAIIVVSAALLVAQRKESS